MHQHKRRRTLPSAIGEPMVWLTGGALTVCLAMIAMLFAMVIINGSKTFWPSPIDRLELESGEVVLGIATAHEEATRETEARTLYRTGNRDIGQASFRWINDSAVVDRTQPEDAVMLEREAWGVWFGIPEQIVRVSEDGTETEVIAGDAEAYFASFDELHESARADKRVIDRMKKHDLGQINARLDRERLDIQQAQIEADRDQSKLFRFGWVGWGVLALLLAGFSGVFYKVRHYGTEMGSSVARQGKLLRAGSVVAIVMTLISMWVGAPWANTQITDADLASMRADLELREQELQLEYDAILAEIHAIEEADSQLRVTVVEETNGQFAPTSQTLADQRLHMSQIVRQVRPNTMGLQEKAGVYFSRWWEFLSTFPREANTEGGVYPVIIGTVLLTLLLTIVVTPMGVIAALYLREYAKQGFVTSMIRIAVNNLAGVPSIVYGVFGLGFFCYTVGSYVDVGPSANTRMSVNGWWLTLLLTGIMIVAAIAVRLWSKPDPGKVPTSMNIALQRVSWLVWGISVIGLVLLVSGTPYFNGLFEARSNEGTPTFGARGLLWASLTLALLTLPVVIVATEEAIAAVPNSMREGSYGCGASKWQTLRRIVLPGALPGILTGAILAMARGAGEVAPLMLVGAVKLNQDLPVDSTAPFLHADRSFMHLGFHIYDLGFQSPDSQAARPLVWTTTLLFLTIVFALNLVAIVLRARVRSRMAGPTV
ncbi:MAG: PstA family ABC transporter permease [Phycisphaerales bacterium JB052]